MENTANGTSRQGTARHDTARSFSRVTMVPHRHKTNPRLIESHWDLEDEFVSLTPEESNNNINFVNSGIMNTEQLHPQRLLLIASSISSAIAVIVSCCVIHSRRRERRALLRAKRREPPSDSCSPTKRARRALTTTELHPNESKTAASDSVRKLFAASAHFSAPSTTEPSLLQEPLAGNDEQPPVQARDGSFNRSPIRRRDNRHVESKLDKRSKFEKMSIIGSTEAVGSAALSLANQAEDSEEAIELANKIRETAKIFEEKGFDKAEAKATATKLVVKKRLQEDQEASSRRIMNEQMRISMAVRSCELQVTGIRHQESIEAQRMNPNWVKNCIKSRDELLSFSRCMLVYMLCGMMLDKVFKTKGFEVLKNAVICPCSAGDFSWYTWTQSIVSWNNIVYSLDRKNAVHSTSIGCWVSCYVQRFLVGLVVLGFYCKGMSIHYSLTLLSIACIVYHGEEELESLLTYCALAFCEYALIFFVVWIRNHLFLKRMKKNQLDNKDAHDDYLLECDNSKTLTCIAVVASFAMFQVTTQGFMLNLIAAQLTASKL